MRTQLATWLLSFCFLMPGGVWAFSSIYAFGDSLSDNGNLADSLNINYLPPYSSIPADNINRVSNGPVAVEVLASELGLALDPALFGTTVPAAGTNYAVSGARAGRSQFGDLSSQITAFHANHAGGAPTDALYVMFIAGNDVRDLKAVTDDAVAAAAITAATQGVEAALNSLISAGAQSILVPNVFDIGKTPDAAANPALATQRTVEYNDALASTLADIETNQGINLFEYDLFGLAGRIAADPLSFNLDNVTDPCTTGLPLPFFINGCNANLINRFGFIDSIHPTATVHEIIGKEMLSAIPVPAALPLFASGLLLFGVWSRRRR